MNKVDAFLAHYSSVYYDPAKAHEYYLKNRKLQPKRSLKGMSDSQRDKWSVVKQNISEEKKSKLTSERDANKQQIEALRANAQARRKQISEKLQKLSARLSKNVTSDLERISDMTQFKIDNLPDSMSPEKRAEMINKIQKSANSKKTGLKEGSQHPDKLAKEREAIGADLKVKIEGAREAFKKAKESINANYEQVYQKEYEKVKAK